VIVNIYGTLRMTAGTKTLRIDLPNGATLGMLFQEIFKVLPIMRSELLDESENLRSDMPVFLNGRNPRIFPDFYNILIKPEDVLSLFSPISSGRINVEMLRPQPSDLKEG
jgi:molybdopterin converting factor small subunit